MNPAYDHLMTLGERIRQARLAKKLTQADVARAFGISRNAVTLWESGDTRPDQSRIAQLAKLLSVTTDWLMTYDNVPTSSESVPATPIKMGPAITYTNDEMMPVRGVANGGEDGRFEFNGEDVQHVRRPEYLAGVKGAYAVYVDGESMLPRFKAGERLNVHPGRPARRGDDVVVELLSATEHGLNEGYIKEFRSKTPTRLILWQHNPPKEIEIDLKRVRSVHVVVGVDFT